MKINTSRAIIALVFGVVMLIGPTVYGQANPLPEHGWALQFAIDRDFDLNSFQGSTLSIKKHTSAKAAWRLGVSVNVEAGDTDDFCIYSDNESEETDSDNTTIDIDMNIQRVFYMHPQSSIKPFLGIGPTGGYYYNRQTTEPYDTDLYGEDYNKKSRRWTAGIMGVLGMEWMPHKTIGLFAEYRTKLYYEYGKSKIHRNDYTISYIERTTKRVRLASESVKMGLAVYF